MFFGSKSFQPSRWSGIYFHFHDAHARTLQLDPLTVLIGSGVRPRLVLVRVGCFGLGHPVIPGPFIRWTRLQLGWVGWNRVGYPDTNWYQAVFFNKKDSSKTKAFSVDLSRGFCLSHSNISKKSRTGPTERTPKPEYLIALATYLGVRW